MGSYVSTTKMQMAFVLSLGMALVVGLGLQYGSAVFTRDKHVLHIITIGIPVCTYLKAICNNPSDSLITFFTENKCCLSFDHQFVASTQPINYLAFVFDGLYYGVSDFAYSAYSMVSYHSPSPLLNLA